MKKSPASERGSKRRAGDLRPEYRFDYAKAQSNRFAGRAKGKSVVVLLAPDVARVFKDGESVNAVLRAVMSAMPNRRKTRPNAGLSPEIKKFAHAVHKIPKYANARRVPPPQQFRPEFTLPWRKESRPSLCG
jgi:hypothetical protein